MEKEPRGSPSFPTNADVHTETKRQRKRERERESERERVNICLHICGLFSQWLKKYSNPL